MTGGEPDDRDRSLRSWRASKVRMRMVGEKSRNLMEDPENLIFGHV